MHSATHLVIFKTEAKTSKTFTDQPLTHNSDGAAKEGCERFAD